MDGFADDISKLIRADISGEPELYAIMMNIYSVTRVVIEQTNPSKFKNILMETTVRIKLC